MPFDDKGNWFPPGGVWAKDKKKTQTQSHPTNKKSLQMDDIDDDLAANPYTPVEPIAGPPAPETSAADSMINYLDRFKTGASNVFGAITDTVGKAAKNTFESISDNISNLGTPDLPDLQDISKAGNDFVDKMRANVPKLPDLPSFDEAFQHQMNSSAMPQFFKDRINESPLAQGFTQPNIPGRSVGQDLGAGLRRWSDGQYNMVANTARMTGNQELGDNIAKLAPGSEGFEPEYKFDGWHSLYDPHWLAGTMIGEGVPSMLSFIPLALGGAEVGAVGASAMGLGKVGTTIMRALGGTLASRPVESTMEAAQTYEQMQGTHEEKQAAANDTFLKNMAVGAPMDMLQLSTIFMPKVGGIVSKLKLDSIGAKVAANSVMEAGEEGVQHWIQNSSQGKETSLSDPALHESMMLGGLLGGFSSAGMSFAEQVRKSQDAVNSIHTRAISKMDDETKADFQDSLDDAKSQGIPEEVAKTRLLETWANTPEGEQAIAESTAEIVESVRQADVVTMKMDGTSPAVESGQYMTEEEINSAAPEVAQMEPAAVSPEVAQMEPTQTMEDFTNQFSNEIDQRIQELTQQAAEVQQPTPEVKAEKPLPAMGDIVKLRPSFGTKAEQQFVVVGDLGKGTFKIRSEETGKEMTINKAGITEIVGKQEISAEESAKLQAKSEFEGMKNKFASESGKWKSSTKLKHLEKMQEFADQHGIEMPERYKTEVKANLEVDAAENKNRQRKAPDESWQDAAGRMNEKELNWELQSVNMTDLRTLRDELGIPKSKGHKGVVIKQIVAKLKENAAAAPVEDASKADLTQLSDKELSMNLMQGFFSGDNKTLSAAEQANFDALQAEKNRRDAGKESEKRKDSGFSEEQWAAFDQMKQEGEIKKNKFEPIGLHKNPQTGEEVILGVNGKDKPITELERYMKPAEPAAPNVLNDHHARIKERAEKARQRIKTKYGSGGNTLNSGLPLDLMADLTLIGYDKILDGIADFKAWSDEMVKEAPDGERVRKWLPAVFAQANHIHSLPEEEVASFIDELLIDAHGENPDAEPAAADPAPAEKVNPEEAAAKIEIPDSIQSKLSKSQLRSLQFAIYNYQENTKVSPKQPHTEIWTYPAEKSKFGIMNLVPSKLYTNSNGDSNNHEPKTKPVKVADLNWNGREFLGFTEPESAETKGTKPGVLKRGMYVKHRTRFGDQVMIVDTINNKGYPGENVIIQDPNNREEKGLGAVVFPEDLTIVPAPETAKKEPAAEETKEPAADFGNLHFVVYDNKAEMEAVRRSKPKSLLMSYNRWKKKGKISEFIKSLGYKPNIIVDNGAYSGIDVGMWEVMDFFQQEYDNGDPSSVLIDLKRADYEGGFDGESFGIRKEFPEFFKYMDWIDSNSSAIDYVIPPDLLTGDLNEREEKILYAFQLFQSANVKLIPVFPYGSDRSFLDSLIEEGADYIGLGGTAKGVNENQRAEWASSIVKDYPDIKFHMLGTNNQRLIDKIPGLYSADGSTWRSASMHGKKGEERITAGAAEISKREEKAGIRKPAAGKVSTVVTERGTEVKTRFAIVDAKDLIASHTTDFKPNESYPQDIQPRDRERAGMQDQVRRLSGTLKPNLLGESPKAGDGAPIVSPELEVESGNGRTMAIQMMYENHTSAEKKYREWLQENASEFGFNSEDLPGNPVLIRIRETDMTMEERIRFAHEANESNVSRMSATERAQADAAKLTPEMMDLFSPGDEGNIMAAANRDFVQSFMASVVGPNERTEVMDKAGALSQDGINRIKAAIFAKAYGNTAAIERLVESTDNNVKAITNALLNTAPRMASMRTAMERGELYPELDLSADIIAATEKLSSLRDEGQTVEFYMSQGDIFGSDLNDETKNLLVILDSNKRSAKKIGAYLNAYLDIVEAAGDPNQISMFGDNVVPTKIEAQQAALQKLEVTNDENQITLWSNQAEGSEQTPTPGNEKTIREEKPEEKVNVIDQYKANTKKLKRLEYNLADIHAQYELLVNNEAEIKAHFLDLINNHEQHKRKRANTKADLVEKLYKDSLDRLGYADSHIMQIGSSYEIGSSYFGSRDTETHAQKIKKVIDKITDESIAKHIAKQLAEVESHKKAMENPETLQELQKKKAYSALTEEEQARYDELTAEKLKDRKQEEAKAKVESKAAVEGVRGGSVSFDIRESAHTKTGEKLWVAALTEKLPDDLYKEIRSKIKAIGGYYSNFKPNVGFIFKDDPTEKLAALTGGETVKLDTGAAFEEKQADKLKSNAEKLRGLAEGMQERINDLRRDRKTHTHRMASQAASAASEADGLERIQKVMFNIAAAIESGEAKHLDGISARIHIIALDSILTRRVYELMQANNEPMNDRNGNRIRRDPKLEDINGMEYPKPQIPIERLEEFLDGMKAKKLKLRTLAKIDKLTYDVRKKGGYLVDVEHYMTEMQDLVSAAKDAGTVETTRRGKSYSSKINLNQEAQWINDYMMTVKRLQTMGIEKPEQLRAALREYLTYREGTGVSEEERKRRELKQREGEATRTKITGFFPTPTPIVERMIDEADIQPGMRVLEPSAGKGNIADAIREANPDAKLDVIEWNASLRAILEDKDFNVVGEDFLELHSNDIYDRIIMNPPFENGQDIEHVQHAYEILNTGGRIVAIMSEGPFYRSDKKAAAFRDWLDIVGGVSEPLEEGAFKSSERPTGVRTRIVTIDKGTAQEEVQKKIENFEKKIKNIDENPAGTGNERYSQGAAKEIMENEVSKLQDQLSGPESITVDQVNDEIVKLLDERNDFIKQRTEAGNTNQRQKYDDLSGSIESVTDEIAALRELLIERKEAKYPEVLPLYRQYRDVLKLIDKLEGRSRDPYLDQVAKMFHLGTVGGAQHGNREMRKLNKRREQQLEKSIELSKKLNPLYEQRSRLEVKINNIERGKAAKEAAAKAKIREEVMNAGVGDIVEDSSYGNMKVIRVNQKTLTLQSLDTDFKEARPHDLILRVVKKASAEQEITDKLRGQQRSDNMGFVPGSIRNDRPRNSTPRMNKFESSDPEVEARLKKAVYRPPTAWDRIKEWMETVKRQATREFQHLPNKAPYSRVRFELHRMQKAGTIAQDVVIREYLTGITRFLNKEDYELMMRIVVLRDLKRDHDREIALKFGYTIDVLDADLAYLEDIAKDNNKVTDALELRNRLFKEKTDQLIAAYAKIGIDIKDKFQLENYLRHLVLEYVNGDRQISAAKKTVKANTNSGYMKKREAGSDKDFVVDILTADTEVLTKMITDMQTSEVLNVIMHDKKLNIKDRLKVQAKNENQDQLDDLFESEIKSGKFIANPDQGDLFGGEPFSPSEQEYKTFAKRIAIGMGNLSKLASADKLWTGENGEFKDVVDSLKKKAGDVTDDENSGTDSLFKYLSALLASGQEGASAAGMVFKAVQERKKWIREAINFKTWEDMIPEGWEKFEPSMASKFYPVQEVDMNRLAKDLAAGVLTEVASTDDLLPYLETAFKKAQAANVMVIPEELAATLIDLSDTHERSSAFRAIKAVNNFMKRNLLFAAPKFIQYEIRNFSSDTEKLFQNKPAAFKYLMRSASELYRFVLKDHVAPNDNVKDYVRMGGMQTLYGVAELGDLHKLEQFTRFYEKNTNIAEKAWNGYWNATRRIDTFRETTVRYALYLAFMDEMNKNGGNPKSYASSVPEEVDTLETVQQKAFLLANDALIDYSKTSHLGRRARDTVVPFWSFQEGNIRSNVRWMRNVIHDKNIASAVGRKLLGKAVAKTPYYAFKVGKAYLAISMLTILLAAWNHGLHDDEEEELPDDVRSQLHIIWGRDSKGNIAYTSGLGAAEDFFKWVGMDDLYTQMMDLASGRSTFQEVAHNIVIEQPVNKLVGLVNPIAKNIAEGLTGVSTYPNVLSPQKSGDSFDDKMIQLLGVGNEYKALKKAFAGVPSKDYDVTTAFTTKKNTGEAAYYEIKELARAYKKRIGSPMFSGGGERSAKSEALYQFKQALKFGDEEAADKYLMRYAEAGGSMATVNQSLEDLNPLNGLSDGETAEFLDGLTPADQKRYDRAMEFFTETLLGNKPMK